MVTRLAGVDIAKLRVPELFSGLRIDCDEVVIERREEDLAVVIGEAARDDVAAGFAGGGGIGLRRVGPFQLAAGRIECEKLVGMHAEIGAMT